MNDITKTKQRLRAISLILVFLMTSTYAIFLLETSNSLHNAREVSNKTEDDIELKTNIIGTHTWWNKTFRSRQLINITNPYSVDFENYGVSISFNYATIVTQGKMNESLKDIRIIEYDSEGNPFIRKYYYRKNYPNPNYVTVWFDTNISATTTEYDTYLYYGNDEVEVDTTFFMNKSSASSADNFGWIRNGNFELDIVSGTKISNFFGWYYADDVPNDVSGAYTPTSMTPDDYQHNLSNSLLGQEHVQEGNYAFKWGDIAHDVSSGGIGDDIVGTLFSYPFKVPKATGGNIGINAWHNIRMYDSSKSKGYGYFARIATSFSTDVNSHTGISYGELWDSIGEGTKDTDFPTYARIYGGTTEVNTAGITPGLTGNINIDLSDYEGLTVFLEFGFYAPAGEFSQFAAFGQVDAIKFNYTLTTTLNSDVEDRMSEVTIFVRDVDGRIVPNADVSLVNYSEAVPIYDTQTTSIDDGSVVFTSVDYKTYDIVVNYTIDYTGNETVVYNSSEPGRRDFVITESTHVFEVEVDLWTIDFEIVDFGKEALNYGYIEINYTKGGGFLDNLTLDSDGKATFRWKNQSQYYYRVYYDNDDYNLNPTLLNESYIYRSVYENDKIRDHTFLINQTNLNDTGIPSFSVNQRIYTNGSLIELGNKKIISAKINISLFKAENYLDRVQIFYIDKNNSTTGNLIYENTSYLISDKSDIIEFNITSTPLIPANLKEDLYEVYGLLIKVEGQNTTRCDGLIKINLTETCNIYNVTDLCKVNIKIIDSVGDGVSGCLVKVNSTIGSKPFNVNLLTRDFTGYAYGQINIDLPLWYLRGYTYNFSLVFFGSHKNLIVNYSDQYFKEDVNIYYYNYTLLNSTDLIFEVYLGEGVNASLFQTKFKNLIIPESVIWSENITVQVNFTLTENDWVTSEPVSPPAEVFCYIKTTGPGSYIVLKNKMNWIGDGIFDITFNSSHLSAGNNGKLYSIIISGSKTGYSAPTNLSDSIFIDTVPTVLTMHDYYNNLNIVSEFSQTFGELINLTVKYYNNTNLPLKGARLTYEWLYYDPIQFYEDPINEGYYTATIDTSLAEVWGTKSIEITAKQENYTTQVIFTSLIITERSTTLNNETDLVYINSKVWVEDPNPFEFIYQDVLTEENIGNLTTATYTWEELYPNGTRILEASGTGFLVQNGDNTHTLDFRTELKSIGFYYLYVTLHKQNYKAKSALINLEIMSRVFDYTLSSEQLVGNIITIRNGDPLDLNLNLQDLTRYIPLENATISMMYQNKNYTFSEELNGSYSLEITDYTRLSEDEISTTSTTSIIISKANFTSQTIDITILLKNRIFNISISKPFKNNLIKIVSGDRLSFDIALNDSYDNSGITDGTITIFIGNQVYDDLTIINNGDGTYTITFTSYPEAFTSSKTLSGEIIIQKTNFKTERISITIEIRMAEIFPGMPTFYFILITISIIGILGSVVAYRVIQQARIPKHIKKIKKVKSLIKSKKKITEIIDIPTKAEMTAKLFGNEWKEIGLSIEKSLGIEDLKKKLSIKDKLEEQRGDIE